MSGARRRQRAAIEAGEAPFALGLVGMTLGGRPITDYAPDFWLVHEPGGGPVGYLTSAWFSPELGVNIALGYVPWERRAAGTAFEAALPVTLSDGEGPVPAEVHDLPFRRSEHAGARERKSGESGAI